MTKKCKDCQSEIDSKAKRCSKCGADQRGGFTKHKILYGILAVIVIVIIIGIASSGSKSTTSTDTSSSSNTSNNNQAAIAKPSSAPTVIDATSLVAEYDKNKLAAQDKYTGKVVQTTAYIKNISNDITGSYYLSLEPTSGQTYFGTTIQCYFKDKNQLTSLSNSQSITVSGTMQEMSLGIVAMKDCQVIK